jgi:serine kinase of HPr protein (carbohydrate metabolism regulator)
MGNYYKRFTDTALQDRLRFSGAVLIQGPKGCGKTETAVHAAKSLVRLDTDDEIRKIMEVDPTSVLTGKVPRLIDEWQEYPRI